MLDRYRRYQLKTSDLFGLDPLNLNKKSASKGWVNFANALFLRLCDPLIRDKAMLPVLVENMPWYLEPTPCCLVTATSLAKLPMVSGFQRDDNFPWLPWLEQMSFFKGVFFESRYRYI